MVRVTFITHGDDSFTVDANVGASLKDAAVLNGVPGIDADCGGACACATCQVYIEGPWRTVTGSAGEAEKSMLGFATSARDNSRLSCQIPVTAALEGLVVRIPEQQN